MLKTQEVTSENAYFEIYTFDISLYRKATFLAKYAFVATI